jgi:cytochrome c oxidase subunit 2
MHQLKTFLTLCAIVGCMAAQAFAQATSTPTAAREIQMTAKKYEFNPNVITVKKGERVKLIITALDRDHGFKLEAFGINQKLKKGDPTTIEFTADKAGTFPFQCSEFCGLGHRKMKGKLVVEEQ